MLNNEENMYYREVLIEEKRRKRDNFVRKMTPIWIEEGKKMRYIRDGLCISRREISELIGFSTSTVASFEAGNPIRNRWYFEKAYRLAIKYIQIIRREIANDI